MWGTKIVPHIRQKTADVGHQYETFRGCILTEGN
jgi:hypothetical protein